MKLILVAFCALISTFAFSFSTITLNKNVQLSRLHQASGYVVGKALSGSGDESCTLELAKESVTDHDIVPLGTLFLVNGPVFSSCGDFPVSWCSTSLSGSTPDKKVSFYLLCKDLRPNPEQVSVESMNKISSELFIAQ